MSYEKYSKVTPGAALLTLSELQDHLNVDDPNDDNLINGLIAGWTKWAEEYCWTNFTETVWKLETDIIPTEIQIRRNPVTAITSIDYYDEDDNLQVYPSSEYVFYSDIPARIVFDDLVAVYDRPDAVTINFTVEYADAVDMAKLAIQQLIGLQYLQREDFSQSTSYMSMARRMLAPHRLSFFL